MVSSDLIIKPDKSRLRSSKFRVRPNTVRARPSQFRLRQNKTRVAVVGPGCGRLDTQGHTWAHVCVCTQTQWPL